MKNIAFIASLAVITLMCQNVASAASNTDIQALRSEIQNMKNAYEKRIIELEKKLHSVEKNQATTQATIKETKKEILNTQILNNPNIAPVRQTPATARRNVFNNSFNPSIGIVFNGQFNQFSSDNGDMAGFAVGHESERPKQGFAVDHTELNFSANVDDKFFGSTTMAIAQHEGETEIELEEAFVQTQSGLGLPTGLFIKAGRAFWTLGYLNEHHNHVDDFVDRPLPYRSFIDGAFNDDGAEVSYLLPTDFYAEIGAGIFSGDRFPYAASTGDDVGAWSAFMRVGNDISDNQSWRLGGYVLSGKTGGERDSNDHGLEFNGDTNLYIADLRYSWAPNGNQHNQEFILQGEYFLRTEDGTYEDTAASTGAVNFDKSSSGWYAQAVYKFDQQWRIGTRYSQLNAADVPTGLIGSTLDSQGHNPQTYALMMDWTNSEFSRVRMQYNHEELSQGQKDDQLMVQYIMSIGAHGAHKY